MITDSLYLANWPVVVALDAQDASSGITNAQLGAGKGTGTVAWSNAQPCADATGVAGGPAWCATFTPSGAGSYRLLARATDRVGRVGESAAKTVYVDAAAPTLTFDQSAGALLNASRSTTDENTWLIHLSGTVKDQDPTSSIKSGIPVDGVRVTLRDADGNALGEVGQVASVSGTAWSLDYRVQDAKPDGCYTAQAEAVDNVARTPNLPDEQVSLHMTTKSLGIVVDATAPQVLLDQAAFPDGQIDGTVKSLGGATTERPVGVQIVMTRRTRRARTRRG